jgi:hypothetical protein
MTTMSSTGSSPRSASRQPPLKSAPLAERSQSQTNRPSLRLLQDSPDQDAATVFSSTPFPTKPAHVLLPSAIRERRLGSNDENNVPGPGVSSRSATANTKAKRLVSDITPEGRVLNPAPTLTLKRSVKALRDLYEAQAERSRPSTATSPVTSPILRPSTASSGLRSISSREGLKGPQAWEFFHKAYSDEIGNLPSLDEVAATVRQIESQLSLTAPDPITPTPNLLNYTSPPSPPPRLTQESSSPNVEAIGQSSSSGDTAVDSSSPIVVRLEESSSPTATSAEPSSPNVIKLGSSSPSYNASRHSDLNQEFNESPDTVRTSRILARVARVRDGTSFAERMQSSDGFASSPPGIPSSSPIASSEVDLSNIDAPYPASSPAFESAANGSEHSNGSGRVSQDAYSSKTNLASESHTNLQVALSSSPAPIIQYPTVRAPKLSYRPKLNVAKRSSRSMAERYAEKWDPRLSAVPSEWSEEKEAFTGPASVDQDTSTDEYTSDDDSFLQPPARAYLASNRYASGSTVRIVSEADRREATDFIADLRPSEYRTPPLQARPSGLLSMLSSSASLSNSMRNSVDTRLNSMRSFTSSRHNSISRSIRRPGSSSSLVSNLPIPTWARRYYSGAVPKDYFYSASQISSTTTLPQRPTTSTPRTPRTPVECVTSIFRPRTRPRLPPPRQSHLLPGVGPLVSNPVNQRPVSIALHPADPRAHWAGAEESALTTVPNEVEACPTRPYSPYRLFPNRREWSPHLHTDSRAAGLRNRWHAPSMDENRETLLNWRNAQVLGFILGFVFPLSWFVAAFCLPLPPKPNLDTGQVSRIPTPNVEAKMQQKMDIEDDIRFENARWWRGLNRGMCVVGLVVIVLVITLALVYH